MGLVPWALRTLVIAEAEIPFSECDQFPRFPEGFGAEVVPLCNFSEALLFGSANKTSHPFGR